jgi:hypothetical protein
MSVTYPIVVFRQDNYRIETGLVFASRVLPFASQAALLGTGSPQELFHSRAKEKTNGSFL